MGTWYGLRALLKLKRKDSSSETAEQIALHDLNFRIRRRDLIVLESLFEWRITGTLDWVDNHYWEALVYWPFCFDRVSSLYDQEVAMSLAK